uniref:Ion_trans domain-containing protein n=1 Tax=Mesocestoides corti TaxID=53468 RepID=A0A5K3ENA4_MESCO
MIAPHWKSTSCGWIRMYLINSPLKVAIVLLVMAMMTIMMIAQKASTTAKRLLVKIIDSVL